MATEPYCETMPVHDVPSEAATTERAASLVNEAMFAVALQRRRIRSDEPEDKEFVFRRWADLQFSILVLRRLRRAVELARQAPTASASLTHALNEFDRRLPMLSMMDQFARNVSSMSRISRNDGCRWCSFRGSAQ